MLASDDGRGKVGKAVVAPTADVRCSAVFTTTGVLDWWILGAARAMAAKRRVTLA